MKIKLMRKREGVYNEVRKERTDERPIEAATVPEYLVFPLNMHIGVPANPIVEVGDKVKIGTLIAEKKGHISANIYASVSGEVFDISDQPTVKGIAPCITIKNNYKEEWEEPFYSENDKLTVTQMKEVIDKAGIVGMGGATFPTSVKLSPPSGTRIDTLIINGAECEPYSTADHRLMVEHAVELIEGVRILARILDVNQVYVALESDTHDSAEEMKKIIDQEDHIDIVELETIYPQGSEKNLIKKLTNREVPSGGLPADVHTVVVNVATALAVYEAIHLRRPSIERITTVSGEPIKEPKNLRVRIGTPISYLIDDCHGFCTNPGKMIHGGPMMGTTINSGRIPITKGTSVITFLEKGEALRSDRTSCIKCSECLNVCPVSLQPILISQAYENGDLDEAERLGALDCIDCGNCSYICPAKVPLLDNIRAAKKEIRSRQEAK